MHLTLSVACVQNMHTAYHGYRQMLRGVYVTFPKHSLTLSKQMQKIQTGQSSFKHSFNPEVLKHMVNI